MKSVERSIEVWGDWIGLGVPARIGTLLVAPLRGKEIFAFEYGEDWINHRGRVDLDYDLSLFRECQ